MKNWISGIVLSLALAFQIGCSTLESIASSSENFVKTFDEPYGIVNLSSGGNASSDEPFFLFFYGFGGSLKEFQNEEKNNKVSRLSVMKDVFDGKVLLADYPCNMGMDYTFSKLEKSFLDFIEDYHGSFGKNPNIIIAGHSFGAELARMFAEKYPQYVEKIGLIAGVNNGIEIGSLTEIAKRLYLGYLDSLIKNEKCSSAESYHGIDDLITGSDFLNRLNSQAYSSANPAEPEYDIYAFVSKDDNPLISGPDDGIVGLSSSYPYRLKEFQGSIKIGDAEIIQGNHFSINKDFDLFRRILESIKSDKKCLDKLPPPDLSKLNN
ncbi:MAG TPA: hypothetical protein VMC80_01535 [Patescibacteria group bacterium]|nr:hypothetical protein [Patescibacteria group bacterium]